MKRICVYNELSILIETDDVVLIKAIEVYLPLTDYTSAQPFRARYQLFRRPPLINRFAELSGARLIDETAMSSGPPHKLWQNEEKFFLIVENQISLEFAVSEQVVMICVGTECSDLNLSSVLLFAIDFAIECCGQFLFHGAVVERPAPDNGCVILFGPSGYGKTTTTLALTLGGFGFITDDAVVLNPNAGLRHVAAGVWGLPRGLKVHRDSAKMMPQIASLMNDRWDSAHEQCLSIEKLSDVGISITTHSPKVDAIVLLGPRSPCGHRLEIISKGEALLEIAADNIRIVPIDVSRKTSTRFNALSSLVSSTPVFRLNVSPDISTISSYFRSQLKKYLEKQSEINSPV